ncbi:MAG: Pycsar system effector family protein, partial [Chitinophagaceae bacterium]
YFTDYGKEQLEPSKLENLFSLKKKKGGKDEPDPEENVIFPYLSPAETDDDEKIKQKNLERGIQTMFRSTSNNHLRLSSMSDNKAHIMISVNSIIIGFIISVVFKNLATIGEYTIPSFILLAVCLTSMSLAILATRPSVNNGSFTEDDIRTKKTNILFFGNFFRMGVDDYQWAMNQMLKDGEYLYNSMIKDIYFLGVVLAKKYRYLRYSYTIFMFGLIIAVIAFAIAAITTAKTSEILPVIDY